MVEMEDCICGGCGAARPETPGPCPSCGDTRRKLGVTITEKVSASVSVSAGVKRGQESWGYFYMVGGVVLAVVLTAISVLDGIPGWARAIAIVCVAIIIIVAFADSGRLHNLLLRLKRAYEDKER